MAHDKHHMALTCPRDRTPLEERQHGKVYADHCPKCDGVFLDADELRTITGKKNVNDIITKYLGVDVGSDLVCPNCGGLMDDEHFKGHEGDVTIDVCLTCHGVWLDKGELESIAALDDQTYGKLSDEKRAEIFDEDMSARKSATNPLARAIADLVMMMKQGVRRHK